MKDTVDVFFHSQQPYTHLDEEEIGQFKSGRLDFPNTYFDPEKAHQLYNQYHEQYAMADEAGLGRNHDQRTPLVVLEHEAVGQH